ncbi:Transcription factor [Quillaja saponaria]|uniref:Transcription factor n=1 Tax=Quillaja saponaria TaxID=32244 RepID=A0AAD7PMV1_QUISA|nr:Transcription factor [Quillaja saponaria]
METTSLLELLKSFCDYSCWNYAVFWKLNDHIPVTLTWEDAYYNYLDTNVAVDTMLTDMEFDGAEKIFSSSCEAAIYDVDYSVQQLMTEMSCIKYTLQEGLVGKVAFTGDHFWVCCDNIFTSQFNTDVVPEYPYEWLLQFASGIKTIVLIPVLPDGVLQFGSFEVVAEDLAVVTYVKEKFNTIHRKAGDSIPFSSDRDIQDLFSSCLTHSLKDNFDAPSSTFFNPLKVENSGSTLLNTNILSTLEQAIPSIGQDAFHIPENSLAEFLSRSSTNEINFPPTLVSDHDSKHINQMEMLESKISGFPHLEEALQACSEWVNDGGVFGDTPNGIYSYSIGDMEGQSFGDTCTYGTIYKNMNSFFDLDGDLQQALGPAANGQTSEYLRESNFSSEHTYSSSNMIASKYGHDVQSLKGDALLEAVVGNLCSVSDDTSSSISNSLKSFSTSSGQFTSYFRPSHSEARSLVTDTSELRRNVKSPFVAKVTSPPTSASFDRISSISIDKMQQEKVLGHLQRKRGPDLSNTGRKRARPNNSQRPRPRDRQLIQDRVKELRELVPNGAKCSIDGLLDQTVKHMLYLRNITKQAEKLRRWVHQEMAEYKSSRSSEMKNCSFKGASFAFEFGNAPHQVFPIVLEDLECPGLILIEVICDKHGQFLEIAQVIRRLELTILKGALKFRSSTMWACFIVEVPKGFHRMDVFWPLMHLLQSRRNPPLSEIDLFMNKNRS